MMGGDVDDDFGEVYADVEVSIFKEEEDEDKNDKDNSSNQCEEEEDDKLIAENGSDSEDDLRIVLNDKQVQDHHDLLLVSATSRSDGVVVVEQSPETGNVIKHPSSTFYSQYHHQQYQYIRPQVVAFAKINGFASSTHRCDWDTNGFPNTPRTLAFSGYDFSLPRHRTILDINIDAFGHKPWKQPGVDITNFFNFGLDEESWKQYCNCMELFRQQTTMATTYQVHGAQVRHQTASPQNVGGESAQIGQVGRVLSVSNDANNRAGRLDMPKGMAIQVDGGIGERHPSMDIRRPQDRDSDVVIQISVQDNMKYSSLSSNKERSLSDNSTLNVFESGPSGMTVTQDGFSAESSDEYKRHPQQTNASTALLGHLDHQGYKDILEVVTCQPHKENERKCKENFEDVKVKMQRNSFIEDPCLEAESTLCNQIQPTSSLSCYEASITETSSAKEKVCSPARREPLSLISGLHVPVALACNQSKRYESNYCKTEQGDNEDQSRNLSRKRGKQGTHSRVRLNTLAERTNCVSDNEALPMLTRNVCHADSHTTKRSCRWRGRQYEKDFQSGEGLPYYRGTEISFGYHRERFVEKPVRNAYTESFNINSPTKLINQRDPCRGHWDEQEYILKKTFTFRGNEARQREHSLQERRHSNERLHLNQGRSVCLTRENFSIEKGRCRWQRRKRNDEEYFWRGADDENCVLGHGYRELYMQGNHGRPASYHDREREYLNEKYSKNTSDRSPCMDVLIDPSIDGAQDDEYWRYLHHESLSPHREFHVSCERKWCEATSPVPTMYNIASKSDEEDMGFRRQARQEKSQSNGLFYPTCKDTHNAVSITISDSDLSNKESRLIRRSKALDWPDRITPRQQNQGKRSSRHVGIHIKKYDLSHSEMFLEENPLVRVRNRKIREETRDSGVNTRIVPSFDIVDENQDKEAAPRQRKSIDLQVVGWNGKASERFPSAGDTGLVRRKGPIDSSNREHKPSAHNRLYSGKVTPDTSKIGNGYLHRLNSRTGKVSESGSSPTSFGMKPNSQNLILEEGQLLVEEYGKKDVHLLERIPQVKETTKSGEENGHLHEVMSEYKVDKGLANRFILETLAKMEKRRERFKEPITPKEADTNPKEQPDTMVEPTELKQQRPARKRRWGRN